MSHVFRLSILLAVFMFLLPSRGLAEETLVVHFEEYPPYEFIEKGGVKGVNVALMREAFRRMGVTPSFVPMPWKRAVYELKNGNIFALASGFKTPEREVFAYYPSESLAMEEVVVVVPTVSGVTISSISDLYGLSVGVVREYAYGKDFDSRRGLKKIEAASNPQLLKMLMSQRMDVAIMNKRVANALAQKMNITGHIRFAYSMNKEPLYLLFSRKRGDKARKLAQRFDAALKSMREDGSYADIEAAN